MSFAAYLTNIEAKTGKSPRDFETYAADRGWMKDGTLDPGIKVSGLVAELKQEFALGHGHAMAIVAYLRGKREDADPCK